MNKLSKLNVIVIMMKIFAILTLLILSGYGYSQSQSTNTLMALASGNTTMRVNQTISVSQNWSQNLNNNSNNLIYQSPSYNLSYFYSLTVTVSSSSTFISGVKILNQDEMIKMINGIKPVFSYETTTKDLSYSIFSETYNSAQDAIDKYYELKKSKWKDCKGQHKEPSGIILSIPQSPGHIFW